MTDIINQNAITEDVTCPSVGYQSVQVCVPVTVKPYAKTGNTFTKCCGAAVITPGDTSCAGTKNGSCSFVITQTLCVAVPVEFGANADVGDTFVNCLGASDTECAKCEEP